MKVPILNEIKFRNKQFLHSKDDTITFILSENNRRHIRVIILFGLSVAQQSITLTFDQENIMDTR